MSRRSRPHLTNLEPRLTPNNTAPALVRDINSGPGGSSPDQTLAVGSMVYFTATDVASGRELWVSDGTAAGTRLVRDIVPGGGSGADSNPQQLTEVNGRVFFTADNNFGNNRELWVTDGTLAGTVQVAEINPFVSSMPYSLTNVSGKLFFYADDGANGTELWTSDGTAANTKMVRDIAPGFASSVKNFGDGATRSVNVGGIFYFAADDFSFSPPGSGLELWRSDGTANGTFLVADIFAGSQGSNPLDLVEFNGKVAFTAFRDDGGRQLWTSDGVTTAKVGDLTISGGTGFDPNARGLFNFGGILVFRADNGVNGTELFRSDGTAGGTAILRDINVGSGDSFPDFLSNVSGTLYFSADDGANGFELWKSDGTSAGTLLVSNIAPGSLSSYPFEITDVAGVAYFVANDGTNGYELWRSDGTTTKLIDVEAGTPASPSALTAVGTTLYFTAARTDVGDELFTLLEDNVPPAIANIDSTAIDGSYVTGQTLPVSVIFTEPVTLTGTLILTLDTGNQITFNAFTGTAATGTFVVTVNTSSPDLNVTSVVLSSGSTLRDAAGNDAVLALPALNLAVTSDLMINLPNTAPTLSDIPNAFVQAGQSTPDATFSVSDVQSSNDKLALSVSSSNPALIPTSAVTISSVSGQMIVSVATMPGVSGVTTITVTYTDPGGLPGSDTFTVSQDTPLRISDVPNQMVVSGTTVGPLPITLDGGLTPVNGVVLSVTSDNPAIPASAVTFGGSGANRTITITTAPGISATTNLTIRASDPDSNETAVDTVQVVQNPMAVAPTVSDIPDQSTPRGTTLGPVAFSVNDDVTPPGSLAVSIVSSNTTLVPPGNISINSDGGSGRSLTITPAAGQIGQTTITVTVTDAGGLTTSDTFVLQVVTPPVPPIPPVSPTPPPVKIPREFAVGRGAEGPSTVRFFNPDGTERFTLAPYGKDYTCGIRVATADFNGDGVADLVAGSGLDIPGQIFIFDGVTQKQLFNLIPFGENFTRGTLVSAGDLNGDGLAELAVTAERGGGARVRVFSPDRSGGFTQIADFFALLRGDGSADTDFRGGARSAIGDVNGDGFGDLIVAAGYGGGPRIAIFDGKALGPNGGPKLRGDFLAFDGNLRNGSYVAAGDLDGDGRAEIAVVPGIGGGPRVTIFSGSSMMQNELRPVADFFAGDLDSRGGLRVAIKDLDDNGLGDVVIGAGAGDSNRVVAYKGSTLLGPGPYEPMLDFNTFDGWEAGVYVG